MQIQISKCYSCGTLRMKHLLLVVRINLYIFETMVDENNNIL